MGPWHAKGYAGIIEELHKALLEFVQIWDS